MRKIQEAAKDLLKAEDSFFVSLGDNKQSFSNLLRSILEHQTGKQHDPHLEPLNESHEVLGD